jgi:outer membrane protein assembly factor BamB
VYLLTSLRSQPQPQHEHQPKVVTRTAPATALDQAVEGFGSAWLLDTDAHRLLRMDPGTRRVTARVAIPGDVSIAVGDQALWMTQNRPTAFRLLSLDPRTDRVVDRIRVPQHSGGPSGGGFPLALDGGVWVMGATGAVRIDQRTGRVTASLTVARNGYTVSDATVFEGDLWVLVSDGRVHRLDGRTGASKAVLRVPFVRAGFVGAGGGLYISDGTDLARMDPATGRLLWRAAIPQIGAFAAIDGLVWAETPDTGGDRIVSIDPRDGRTVASVPVGEFNARWMSAIGPELWLTTARGHLVILAP